jgi:predicted MFS family arabinose efflux permease
MRSRVDSTHVINQSVIYDLLPEARSRLTTVYMTTYFIGGAAGSAAGAQAYQHWGWPGAAVTAAVFPLLGLLAWLAARRYERPGISAPAPILETAKAA